MVGSNTQVLLYFVLNAALCSLKRALKPLLYVCLPLKSLKINNVFLFVCMSKSNDSIDFLPQLGGGGPREGGPPAGHERAARLWPAIILAAFSQSGGSAKTETFRASLSWRQPGRGCPWRASVGVCHAGRRPNLLLCTGPFEDSQGSEGCSSHLLLWFLLPAQ